jgi:heavy metal translocating P-type ATPase
MSQATADAHTTHEDESLVECCAHHNIEIENQFIWYLTGMVLLVVSHIAQWTDFVNPTIAQFPAAFGAILLSYKMFVASYNELKRGKISSSTLAALAILAAFVSGQFTTAGWLAFILLMVDQVVRRTAWGAERAIQDLVELTPDTARVIRDGREIELGLEEVVVGDAVRVRPGENLPVDGKILTGRTTINQASLTGEAMPVSAGPGDPVYAGTTNVTGAIDLEVTSVGEETTIGKVKQLITEAESTKTPRQLLMEQVARFFVPVALSTAVVVLFIMSQSPDEAVRAGAVESAIAVLVVTCPAALLLSSPSAMVAAFASAARLGILIKQSNYLEGAANVNTVVFDKTGTITTGSFEVSRLVPAEGVEGAELLKAAAFAEQSSNHPLALSILRTAEAARIQVESPEHFEEVHGMGVKARTTLGELHVGRSKWLKEVIPGIESDIVAVEKKIEGMSGVHVVRDGKYLGAVGLEDKVRPNAKLVVERLRELGVKQEAIFTGDRLDVAKRVGLAVGVDAVEAECLPEDKHQLITELNNDGYRVLMVGDGINDGPSLAAAQVGVAMGLGGSDIAANSAGVALMTDDLSRIPFLIELARRTRVIIAQNIAASIIIVIIGLVLAATGSLAVPAAALYHFAGDIFVIGNSFRLFRFGENYHEADYVLRDEPVRRARAASARLAGATA